MALIPIGVYVGKLVANDPPIQKSVDKQTQFYDVTGIITEEGEHKGGRAQGQFFMPGGDDEKRIEQRRRSVKSMMDAGAKFGLNPDGSGTPNLRDLTGLGTKEVLIAIKHDTFVPKDKRTPKEIEDGKAAPEPVTQAVIHYINPMDRATSWGKPLEKADEAFLDDPAMKAMLVDVRKNGTRAGTGSAGEKVDGNTLKKANGDEVF